MVKTKKRNNRTKKRRRTSLEIEEEQSRTLYIRLPHAIKGVDEIKSLLFGDFQVKLPRQTSRFCHVIFKSKEDKVKNLKAIKKQTVDGKPIFVGPPRPMDLEKSKKPKQKITIPEPDEGPKIGKYLFISNIPPGVKAPEVKNAFPGSVTVVLLKGLVNGTRHAKVKMASPDLCLQYIKNESEWPELHGKKVFVSLSKKTNNNNNNKDKKKKSQPLKIYDGEEQTDDKTKSPNSQKSKTGKKSEAESGPEDESGKEEDNEEEDDEESEQEEETEESSEE